MRLTRHNATTIRLRGAEAGEMVQLWSIDGRLVSRVRAGRTGESGLRAPAPGAFVLKGERGDPLVIMCGSRKEELATVNGMPGRLPDQPTGVPMSSEKPRRIPAAIGTILVSLLAFTSPVRGANAACPSAVKKSAIVGSLADTPNGFFLYCTGGGKGIYRSPLNQFSPRLIDATRDHVARTIAISSDGRWFVYCAENANQIYVVSTSSGKRWTVPTEGSLTAFREMVCGIHRGTGSGDEIIYKSDATKIRAVAVQWTESGPTFGRKRLLASFSSYVRTSMSASGSQLLTELDGVSFVTIPDGGGTADDGDVWKPIGKNELGCFTTMSHDGAVCVFNPGLYGDEACIPNESGGMWHKGFVATPFMEMRQSSISMSDLVMKRAESVNWCPEQYRFGAVWEVDFSMWYIGNNPEYVIGAQGGTKTPVRGVWLVHRSTNTWTLLTGKDTKSSFPAVHFAEGTGTSRAARSPAGARMGRAARVTSYYDLAGRRFGDPVVRKGRAMGAGVSADGTVSRGRVLSSRQSWFVVP